MKKQLFIACALLTCMQLKPSAATDRLLALLTEVAQSGSVGSAPAPAPAPGLPTAAQDKAVDDIQNYLTNSNNAVAASQQALDDARQAEIKNSLTGAQDQIKIATDQLYLAQDAQRFAQTSYATASGHTKTKDAADALMLQFDQDQNAIEANIGLIEGIVKSLQSAASGGAPPPGPAPAPAPALGVGDPTMKSPPPPPPPPRGLIGFPATGSPATVIPTPTVTVTGIEINADGTQTVSYSDGTSKKLTPAELIALLNEAKKAAIPPAPPPPPGQPGAKTGGGPPVPVGMPPPPPGMPGAGMPPPPAPKPITVTQTPAPATGGDSGDLLAAIRAGKKLKKPKKKKKKKTLSPEELLKQQLADRAAGKKTKAAGFRKKKKPTSKDGSAPKKIPAYLQKMFDQYRPLIDRITAQYNISRTQLEAYLDDVASSTAGHVPYGSSKNKPNDISEADYADFQADIVKSVFENKSQSSYRATADNFKKVPLTEAEAQERGITPAAAAAAAQPKQQKAYPELQEGLQRVTFKKGAVTDMSAGVISDADIAEYKADPDINVKTRKKTVQFTPIQGKAWSDWKTLTIGGGGAAAKGKLDMGALMKGRRGAMGHKKPAKSKKAKPKYPKLSDNGETAIFKLGDETDWQAGIIDEDDAQDAANVSCIVKKDIKEVHCSLDNDCKWVGANGWKTLEAEEEGWDDDDE